ncbi:prealbumin-like fold domain-containing protein [Anaerofustis butyriciformans]|uniref:MSCRAMM family protein n=1 Tax=Anaerofustis butyriciformans TaxID=3108533 RepID=UPI002E34ABBD|nr:prealbumin-like fold domain-containing protein [Anaerofustis sp. HA2171]
MYILKNIRKKITIILMAVFMFSFLVPMNMNVVKGATTMLSARVADSAYNYNPNAGNLPAAFRQHTASTSLYWANEQGGKAVYCIEIDNHSINGGGNYNTSSTPPISISIEQQWYLSAAIALGHTSGNNQAHQTATQAVIWMIMENAYNNSTTRNAILNGFIANDSASNYAKQLWSDIVEFYEIPSFASMSSSSSKTYEMKWNSSTNKYEVTLKDTKGVTNNFSYSATGLTFSKTASSLKITAPASYSMKNGGVTIKSSNTTEKYKNKAKLVYMTSGSYQKMITYDILLEDPIIMYFKLDISDGDLIIDKEAEDGFVEGMKYTIKGTADNGTSINKTVTTNSKGTVTATLPKGTYTVTELNIADRYVQNSDNKPRQVKVLDGGRSVTTKFINNLKYRFYLEKESEDGFVEGMKFRIQGIDETTNNMDYDRTVSLDENGKFKVEDLTKGGKYKISEVETPDRYIQPKEQIVELPTDNTESYTVTVKFYNELKHHLELEKRSEDDVIAGLKFEVKGIDEETGNTDFLEIVETDDVGKWHLELEKAGKYQITELTPDRYEENEVQIVDLPKYGGIENTTYVTFENNIKKGNVHIEKTTDYPKDENGNLIDPTIQDEALANAEFEIYRINKTNEDLIISIKMNEDLQLNIPLENIKLGQDMLVTTITTDKNGKASFNDLWYGEYYIIEKTPPSGFVLDTNKYYFNIRKEQTENKEENNQDLKDNINNIHKGRSLTLENNLTSLSLMNDLDLGSNEDNIQNETNDTEEKLIEKDVYIKIKNKAKIGSVWLNHNEDVNEYGVSVKTGDSLSLYEMISLFLCSALCLIGLIYMFFDIKNKNNPDDPDNDEDIKIYEKKEHIENSDEKGENDNE